MNYDSPMYGFGVTSRDGLVYSRQTLVSRESTALLSVTSVEGFLKMEACEGSILWICMYTIPKGRRGLKLQEKRDNGELGSEDEEEQDEEEE